MENVINFLHLLNNIWGGGLEAITGTTALLGIVPILYLWYLPRYTAVVFHNGTSWLDIPGVWSAARGVAGGDLEQFTKQWAGQQLTGRFITSEQARIPVNPIPRKFQTKLFGEKRGKYFVVGMKVLDQELIQKFELVERPTFNFEKGDEMLPLK